MREAGSRHGPLVIRGGILRDPAPLSHPTHPHHRHFREKLAQHAIKHRFLALWSMLGELFRARTHTSPSRANFFAHEARQHGDIETNNTSAATDAGRVKPPAPLLAPKQRPLKPATPLHPKTAPKTPISHPQRRWRFQLGLSLREQRRRRFHTRDSDAGGRRQGLAGRPVGGRRYKRRQTNTI